MSADTWGEHMTPGGKVRHYIVCTVKRPPEKGGYEIALALEVVP